MHGAANSASISTEDIFSHAEKYTLELSVEITTPFIGDDVGSYGGAVFLIDKERGLMLIELLFNESK